MPETQVTLTPAMLRGITEQLDSVRGGKDVADIHVAPRNGSTVLVTLDAGYGTYSFIVNRNGRTTPAGWGEL